jgi:diaminopimelate dehydrogenase
MRKIRLAVVGLGNLGSKCVEAIAADPAMELAGVVRRPESVPAAWLKAPAVTHVSELNQVDAALVCVPVEDVVGTAEGLLQSRVPVVECARLHGDGFLRHKSDIHHASLRHKVAAIVGAGCDPGVLSLFRSHFALLSPHGHTETILHTGASLHHTLAAAGIKGVKKALATERSSAEGRTQRYVYVELAPSADAAEVERAILSDPLFLNEETLVFPVASIADLEESNRGVLIERRAAAAETSHASFLLEARYDETRLAACMMLAAARALPLLRTGAHSLFDLPAGTLWGEQRLAAEKEWI